MKWIKKGIDIFLDVFMYFVHILSFGGAVIIYRVIDNIVFNTDILPWYKWVAYAFLMSWLIMQFFILSRQIKHDRKK